MHKCFKVPTFWSEQSKTVPEWNRSAVITVATSHALTTMPLVTLIHFRRNRGQLRFTINKVAQNSLKTEHHPNLKSLNQEEPLSYLLELLYQALVKIVQKQFLKNPTAKKKVKPKSVRCFLNIYPDWFLSLPCVFDWPSFLSLDSALKICPSLAASVVSNSMKRRESSTHISKDWHMCHVRTTPVSLVLPPPPFLQLFWISPLLPISPTLYIQSIGAKPEIMVYFSNWCISHLVGWVCVSVCVGAGGLKFTSDIHTNLYNNTR